MVQGSKQFCVLLYRKDVVGHNTFSFTHLGYFSLSWNEQNANRSVLLFFHLKLQHLRGFFFPLEMYAFSLFLWPGGFLSPFYLSSHIAMV